MDMIPLNGVRDFALFRVFFCSMQHATNYTTNYTIRIEWLYRQAGTRWLIIVTWLLLIRLSTAGWSIQEVLPYLGNIVVVAAAFATIASVVPLLTKPLLFRIDKLAGTLTLIRFGWHWRKTFELQQICGQLAEQQSHSGVRYYFLLFVHGDQVLAIEEGVYWPLTKLKLLQQLLKSFE